MTASAATVCIAQPQAALAQAGGQILISCPSISEAFLLIITGKFESNYYYFLTIAS